MESKTISQMFYNTVSKHADKDLYYHKVDGDWVGIKGSEIKDTVEKIIKALRFSENLSSENVGIISTNSPYWGMCDYGIICSGCTTVTIYPTLIAPQIEYILKDSNTKVLFAEDSEQLDKILSIWDNCPELNKVVVLDNSYTGEDDKIVNLDSFLSIGEKSEGDGSSLMVDSNPDDLLTLIYTSGTTGNPKGVMLTHDNLISNIKGIYHELKFDDNDRFLSFLPLSHVFERMGGHFTTFSMGCSVYYAESIDTVADNLGEVSPTVVLSVPRLYEKMYSRIVEGLKTAPSIRRKLFYWAIDVGKDVLLYNSKNKSIPIGLKVKHSIANKLVYSKVQARVGGALRFFISGGAPLSQEIAEFFASVNITILEGYGLTETSPVLTSNTPEFLKYGTVGKTLFNVEVKIAEDGEILAKGPNIMKGYYNKEQATNEAIDSEGWFHTGDIGKFDNEGYLKITDRKKSILVTSAGKNVAPAPLENALATSVYIEQVMVVGDKRNFISAVIVPSVDSVSAYLESEGKSVSSPQAMIDHPLVVELIDNEVARLMENFSNYERVKKVALLAEPLSIEKGELTPKLSIVRKVVLKNYNEEIDNLYKES
jgi:long-chain acyl-CoA synthetase